MRPGPPRALPLSVIFQVIQAVKRYAGAVALGPIDLSIDAGDTIALLGTSGAGKSTLVRFRGAPIVDAPAVRRQIGYVVQGGGLFPHLDAGANVALVARYLNKPEDEIAKRLDALCELVRLPRTALSRYPSQMSGGQAQRVSLMRALMLDCEVLLFDEPLGALDPVTRFDLQQDLRGIFTRLRKTVVIVTHDLREAQALTDRALLMRNGQVLQDAPVAELIRAPKDEWAARFVKAQS
jgi:osmoprotectant transport system ATP-binding protein